MNKTPEDILAQIVTSLQRSARDAPENDGTPERDSTPESDAIEELNDPFAQGEPDDDEVAAITTQGHFRIPSGKYKGLTLPRMIGVKPSYYAKVMQLKEQIVADPEFQQHASSIAQTYGELRREAEDAARTLSDVKLRLAAVMLLMIDQFEAENVRGITLKNYDKVRWQPEPHLVVTDKEEFRKWCLANGFEHDMVLPWGKANKHVKDMLVNGESEPPGAECYMRPKVVFEKGDK